MRLIRSVLRLVLAQMGKVLQVLAIMLVAATGAVGVILAKEIQDGGTPCWLFVGLVVTTAVVQLASMAIASPGLSIGSYSRIATDIQTAEVLRPVDEWASWSFDEWTANFAALSAALLKTVQDIRRGQAGRNRTISCNLMIRFAPSEYDTLLKAYRVLYPGRSGTGCPYLDGNLDDVNSPDDLGDYLALLAFHANSDSREYRLLYLRVHSSLNKALPGGPVALRKLAGAYSRDPVNPYPSDSHQYIPDTLKLDSSTFGRDVTDRARNKAKGYFAERAADLRSFLSIGLGWNGEPTAVLNIDSNRPRLLGRRKVENVALGTIGMYLPVFASLVYVFRERLPDWLTEDNDAAV